jgi:hypothetical protein
MLQKLLFGLVGRNAEDFAKKALTQITAAGAAPAFTAFFNKRMNAASRGRLGDHLINAGEALKVGRVADASGELAQVIGEIDL